MVCSDKNSGIVRIDFLIKNYDKQLYTFHKLVTETVNVSYWMVFFNIIDLLYKFNKEYPGIIEITKIS